MGPFSSCPACTRHFSTLGPSALQNLNKVLCTSVLINNTRLLRFTLRGYPSFHTHNHRQPFSPSSDARLQPHMALHGRQAARRFPQTAPPPAAACCRGCIMSGDITRSVEQPDPSLCSVNSHCRPCWQSHRITTTRPTSRLRHRHSGLFFSQVQPARRLTGERAIWTLVDAEDMFSLL